MYHDDMNNETLPILKFEKQNSFLSNFYFAPFVWQGEYWTTSEHAYQAAKCTNPEQRELIRNLAGPDAAKRAGRLVTCRPDWEDVKISLMLEIVRCKFEQNPEIKQQLLDTKYAHLEEGNWWKDRFWGVCPAGSGNGRNELGKILMFLRDEWSSALG